MATDAMQTRRSALGTLAGLSTGLGLAAWPSLGMTKSAAALRFVAAWERVGEFSLGLLAASAQSTVHQLKTLASLPVPTRAHGVQALADGSVLAIAKRPGDWMLRWAVDGRSPAVWQWAESGRAFNGHAIASPDGQRIYTTETDLDTGMGLVGVRDARSLAKLSEWPTLGMDPHELVWDTSLPQRLTLIVANGGIPTRPETGRTKLNMDSMDSSIVRLDARSGELLGQWRLQDKRLSLRHLAWQAASLDSSRTPLLGIALQAEHETPEQRQSAPVLALFDGDTLRSTSTHENLSGYGGDIAALPQGWAVSCPRAHGVAVFDVAGQQRQWLPLAHACALTSIGSHCWAAGRGDALQMPARAYGIAQSGLQLDNHWSPLLA
jgi:uncharacterized protein